jgi:hypothetical protein
LGDALELACPALVSRATLVNLELLWAEINQNRKFLQVFAKLDWVEGWSVVKKQQKSAWRSSGAAQKNRADRGLRCA